MTDTVNRPLSVVTGANSGIGRATALRLAAAGHRVVGTVRSVARADDLLRRAEGAGVAVDLVELDIASDASVAAGFAELHERFGAVDNLVNNAGIGGNGTVEEATPARILEVLNVDLCGAVRCIQAVLPAMRERASGTIVNVTSMIGRFAAIAQAPYVASKWALEGLSEELALEVAAFGVRVAIVEPGVTKSSIFGKSTDMPNVTGAYAAHYERLSEFYGTGYVNATDAVDVANVILQAIETDDPQLRYIVSWAATELTAGRAAMSDADWFSLGRAVPVRDEYRAEFQRIFDLDLTGYPPGAGA